MLETRRTAYEAGTYRLVGEQRSQEFAAQLRAQRTQKDDKSFVTVRGYASTVNEPYTMYDMFGEYEEQIAATAFDVTLAANPDVAFLVNHTGMTMARTASGTLRLSVDSAGLDTEADLNPQRSDVCDLEIAINDRNIDQMSFAFQIVSGRWNDSYTLYTITEVNLDRGDVSAVNFGANPNTSISARAKQGMDAINHLDGKPLEILAARAAARLAEIVPDVIDVDEPEEVTPASGISKETLEAILNLEIEEN
jgi:HK97 family phage prohead protease